jgi:glucose/arabinose dehydrogenase
MRSASLLPLLAALAACSSDTPGTGGSTGTGGTGGAATDGGPPPIDGSVTGFCALPGSLLFTASGTFTVPGGSASSASLDFLHLPAGFCAHYFGNVGNARNLRFAPGGELFVASPTGLTTGGGANGQNAIVVLPDDNHDGLADAPLTFLGGLPNTQGMMFTPGFFYYQDGQKFMRVPYAMGDRTPSGTATMVVDVSYYYYPLHWPKGIDIADDGTIYISNGGDQAALCVVPHPFEGGILKLDGSADGAQIARGLRNPMSVRCSRGKNLCFATEMAKDYTAASGGREKLIPIRQGDDWGFPCCATTNLPYQGTPAGTDCSSVTPEAVSFVIGDSPFSLAFAPASWPGKYASSAIIALHGAAGSWVGARVVSIAVDPSTGMPLPSSNTSGKDAGGMVDFATGWDDGTLGHGRPSSVEVAPDGRLFIGDDNNGNIFWVAPIGS